MLSDEALLERLIAFPSVSARSNHDIAEFAADYLRSAGCEVAWQRYQNGEKTNVVAWRGEPNGRGLMLSGHLDVVPAEEPDWLSDPFCLTRRDGRFYGRGSADMKAFVALAVNRLAHFSSSELAAPLALLLTADEEIGCVGAAEFAGSELSRRGWPRQVLVGEPTEMRLVLMHKGHLKLRVTLRGKPAHSGYPHLGVNAIELALPALQLLSTLRREMRDVRLDTSFAFSECPFPVLTTAMIQGGAAMNIVPESCTIGVSVRLLPGQLTEAFVQELRARIDTLPEATRDALRLEMLGDSPPFSCSAQSPLAHEVGETLDDPAGVGVNYASDAGPLSAAGFSCVLCGPGSIENAHKANESIGVAEFEAGGAWLSRVIWRFCGEVESQR